MMSVYAVVLLVFGIVLTYLWLIRHFWLRHVFTEDHKPPVHTRLPTFEKKLRLAVPGTP